MSLRIKRIIAMVFSLLSLIFGFVHGTSIQALNSLKSNQNKAMSVMDDDLIVMSRNGVLDLPSIYSNTGRLSLAFVRDGDLKFNDFYFDYYIVLKIPGYSFDREDDFLKISMLFDRPGGTYCGVFEYTFTPKGSYIDENSNFILSRSGDVFYIQMMLDYARNAWKPVDGYDKSVYRWKSTEIKFPDDAYPNYVGASKEKEFSYPSEPLNYASRLIGMSWNGDYMFLIDYEKALENWCFSPLFIIKKMCSQRDSNGEKRPAPIICAYDSSFGSFFLNPDLVSEGRFIDYKFYMRFYNQIEKSYGPEREVTVRVRSTDTIAPRILIDGVSSTEHNGIIQVSYDKARSIEQLEEVLDERIEIRDNSGEVISPTYSITNFEPLKIKDFKVVVSAKDFSNNSSVARITLQIVDDIPPVIKSLTKKIATTTYSRLSEDDILDNFVAIDEIDKEYVKLYLGKNDYYEDLNYTREGIYDIEVKAKDCYGNESFMNFHVNVSMPDVDDWVYRDGILYVTESTSLDAMGIVKILIDEGQLEDNGFIEANILSGNSINGSNTSGEYTMKIEAISNDGTSTYVSVKVKVVGSTSDVEEGNVSNIIVKIESNKENSEESESTKSEKSFLQMLADFFASLWQWFVNLLSA